MHPERHQQIIYAIDRIERNMEIARLSVSNSREKIQMITNHISAEFKPFYTPFDYEASPCKKYIPPLLFSPLELIVSKIETSLLNNSCTPQMVQEFARLLEINCQKSLEFPETIEDAKNLLDDLQDRTPELFE